MSFALAPAAILALIASLPRAKAEEVCELDAFGNQRCHDEDGLSQNVRLVIGLVLIGLALIFVVIYGVLKRRRQRMAAKFASAPSMSYYAPQGPVGQGNWQGQSMGATIPATYDPNAPPQSYRFNGYGQDMGGPMNAPPQYPAATYAPPYGEKEKEFV